MAGIRPEHSLIIQVRFCAMNQLFAVLQQSPSQSILEGAMACAPTIAKYAKRAERICFTNSQKEPKEAHFPPFSRDDIVVRYHIVS
ncbi:hypothetical protein INT47_009685 [Mucor saturninus]|uniref:Uncharacterized protein n=1 Tax=Mucor saturninus TaxID=64648 RepID=A0A8H7QLH4_9FUNG|nr:hypothetical protein INT47_009685 [Mucor saturninus]